MFAPVDLFSISERVNIFDPLYNKVLTKFIRDIASATDSGE